jgi:hypothetical protein
MGIEFQRIMTDKVFDPLAVKHRRQARQTSVENSSWLFLLVNESGTNNIHSGGTAFCKKIQLRLSCRGVQLVLGWKTEM